MKRVLKYPLKLKQIGEPFEIILPTGATFLEAAYQPMAGLVSWFLSPQPTAAKLEMMTGEAFERRHFIIYFTGQEFDDVFHKHLATFSDKKGLIYHLFEVVK